MLLALVFGVFLMLIGVTAIARTPAAADEMYEAVRRVVQRLADRRATDREPSAAWPQAAPEGP